MRFCAKVPAPAADSTFGSWGQGATPTVVWITGLSGAGKTTLCRAIVDLVKSLLPELVVLDGDVVRAAFGHNLGHGEDDRVRQFRRLQSMARVLAQQGLAVLVGAVYSSAELLAWNRENLPGYFEVHIRAPLEFVVARDPKGLYAKALAGEVSDVVGIDITWHEPANPDLVIDAQACEPPQDLAYRVARAVPRLASALPKTAAVVGE